MTYFVGFQVSQRTAICVVDSGVGFLDFIVCCSLRIAKVFRSRRLLQRVVSIGSFRKRLPVATKSHPGLEYGFHRRHQWSLLPCPPFKRIWPRPSKGLSRSPTPTRYDCFTREDILPTQANDFRLVIPADYPWQNLSAIVSDRDDMAAAKRLATYL
jgi:hypothetical protein